jgi:curved DNA-binding protein CbpA
MAKNPEAKNHYAVLGVSTTADQQQIHHAFRAQVRLYHPDVAPDAAPEQFRKIVEAYDVLGDPARRNRYDQSLQSPVAIRHQHAQPEPLIPERRPVNMPSYRFTTFSNSFDFAEAILAEFDTYFDRWF